jgi:hypothetical protein
MLDDTTQDARPLRTSSSIAALAGALAKAQSQFLPITKDKKAEIQTRSGGRFSYHYSDLPALLTATRAALAANELAIVQGVTMVNQHVVVDTTLLHASGEWLSAALNLPVGDVTDPRSVGSAISYGRRYGISALIGVAATDEDDDAAAASTTKTRRAPTTRPKNANDDVPTPTVAPAAPPTNARRRVDPDAAISESQRKLWFAVGREKGWTKDALKTLLGDAFGIESSADLRRSEFDQALALVARGPKTPTREPGEEG